MLHKPPSIGEPIINTNPASLPGPEPLNGKHVTLQRLSEGHFSDLWANVGVHTELWKWWPEGPFDTREEFDAYLNVFLKRADELVTYAVVLPHGVDSENEGKVAGLAFALFEKDSLIHRVAETGLFFGPLLQRTRAGTEAIFLVLSFLFDTLHFRRVQWKTDILNIPSRKAAERYGFVEEAVWRQDCFVKGGRSRDTVVCGMCDFEWVGWCREGFETWLGDENFDADGVQRRKIEEIRAELRG